MAGTSRPPTDCIRVHEALDKQSGRRSIIGVVADHLPPRQTNGTDSMLTFSLTDTSVYDTNYLRMRVFAPESKLPRISTEGDIVIVRNFNLQNKGYGLIGLFTWPTRHAVFSKEHLDAVSPRFRNEVINGLKCLDFTGDHEPTVEEQLYAIDLHWANPLSLRSDGPATTPMQISPGTTPSRHPHEVARRSHIQEEPPIRHPPAATPGKYPPPSTPGRYPSSAVPGLYPPPAKAIQSKETPPPVVSDIPPTSKFYTKDKFRLLKDLDFDVYADLVVQIAKIYPYQNGPDVDIYVTDYTSHENFFLYMHPDEDTALHGQERPDDYFGFSNNGLRKGWQGPYGQYTMAIKLFHPHADAAHRNFSEGDICFLKNIRTRCSSSGNLEARMSMDQRFHDQVNIRRISPSDPRVEALRLRRDEYEKALSIKTKPQQKNNKQHRKDIKTKKAKKRAAELERRALEERESARQPTPSKSTTNTTETNSNQHIIAAHPSFPLTPLPRIINNPDRKITHEGEEILLPFVNAKYRTLLRVVDYAPHDLTQFTKRLDDQTFNPASEAMDSTPDGPSAPPCGQGSSYNTDKDGVKWEWAFHLLVEDAMHAPAENTSPTRHSLVVGHASAEYLLKLDATDLRKSEKALRQLREKMFLLWGNLEEVTSTMNGGEEVQEEVQSRPFEACVMEYGVKDEEVEGGWIRCLGLFGTSVR